MNRRTLNSSMKQLERRKTEVFRRYIVEVILGFGSLVVSANVEALLQVALGSLLVLVFSAMYDLNKYFKLDERIEALKELEEKLEVEA